MIEGLFKVIGYYRLHRHCRHLSVLSYNY